MVVFFPRELAFCKGQSRILATNVLCTLALVEEAEVMVVVKVRLFRAECLWLRRQWHCGLAMLVNLVGREMATA